MTTRPVRFDPEHARTTLLILIAAAIAGCQPRPAEAPTGRPPPAQEPEPRPGPSDRPAGEPQAAPPRPEPEPEPGAREIFPGVRADLRERTVEFDGVVPIDAHDPRAPRVYLEVMVCAPDTKEHESLVMTRARASHIHAALLAIGLEPGRPGGFSWEDENMTTIPPRGDPVEVLFIHTDERGQRHEAPPEAWVINAESGERFGHGGGFVFAGSVFRERAGREVYDADGVGTIVGLTTFGAETVAWREVISPDSQVQTPEWIADPARTPPMGTAVTVRLRPAVQTPQPE